MRTGYAKQAGACLLAGVLMFWAAGNTPASPPAAVNEAAGAPTARLTQGTAIVERLGPIFVDGAGEMVGARAGDWRLSNELASFTFAATDSTITTNSHPVSGHRPVWFPSYRHPGALIDAAIGGDALDPLAFFTQGVGGQIGDPIMIYDSAEAVERPGEVGLRLVGLPFPNALVQLETIYWLAPGRPWVGIESRLIGNVPPGAEPVFTDIADWGWGQVLVPNQGFLFSSRALDFTGPIVLTRATTQVLGLTLPQGALQGRIQGRPAQSRTLWTPATGDSATTASGTQLIQPGRSAVPATDDGASSGTGKIHRRQLWFSTGSYQGLLETLQRERGLPTGSIEGIVKRDLSDEPASESSIHIMQGASKTAAVYSVAEADAEGRYRVELPPGRYFLKPVSRSIVRPLGTLLTIDVTAGGTEQRDLRGRPDSVVNVRVIDEDTSEPLAARVRFQPIDPTASMPFLGYPVHAGGYYSQAYVAPGGSDVLVPAGKYIAKATHGLEYGMGEEDFELSESTRTQITVRVKRNNPTDGWTHLELGARTQATPGVTVTPEDLVLMAAAEGIHVLVSGDFDVITDLQPVVRKLGLQDKLRAARGFRTAIASHPEWGQMLVYPVPADAPDPAKVRGDWSKPTSRDEVIAALRRHYPGALIQSELPYTDDGQGFLGFGRDPLLVSFDRLEGEKLDLDAINVFPARQPWREVWQTTFWINHWLRGRRYVASTSAGGRTVNGSEPGYPRLLVQVGEQFAQPSEEAWVTAMREFKVQVSSGPFVQFEMGDQTLGGMVALEPELPYRLRVTSPEWSQPSSFSIDKEVKMQLKRIFAARDGQTVFTPSPEAPGEFLESTQSDLELVDYKDSLLGIRVQGQDNLSMMVRGAYFDDLLTPFSFTHPIGVDANGNGKIDPLLEYLNRGR